MPAPHPLAALHAAGKKYAAEAEKKLQRLLVAHEGDVRAAAAALEPPAHEITVHDWLTAWGLRPWLAEMWPDRKGNGSVRATQQKRRPRR